MTKLISSDKIYVSLSGIANAGRGVYARTDIKKGELIERCPVIEVPKGDVSNLTESILITYFYYLGEKKERVFITLGFGSIYNHTYIPNAAYKQQLADKIINFVAIKDIKKGEEITVNYNTGIPKNQTPLWFEGASSAK